MKSTALVWLPLHGHVPTCTSSQAQTQAQTDHSQRLHEDAEAVPAEAQRLGLDLQLLVAVMHGRSSSCRCCGWKASGAVALLSIFYFITVISGTGNWRP